MYIQQLYTGCLAEAAYYIESNGEAAIIDPIRETEPYLELAADRNTKIKFIFETHFHADFVSGHIDLANKTGAAIIFGPEADTKYEAINAKDGERFKLGALEFEVLHTPGHTPESSCYLLYNEIGEPEAVFTGDTLFVGDVGRPDLLDGSMSKEELASLMYDSLNSKIKTLPDHVTVYPAHGAGSACGKNIGTETHSTIGIQKKTNYALQEMSKDDFIKEVTDGILPPPKYFFDDARINKEGYNALDDVYDRNLTSLDLTTFRNSMGDSTVLDTRVAHDFERGFIPNSINIGLNGQYAIWVGTLIDINSKILLVTDKGKEKESVLRLARVGFENVQGYLDGGFEAWVEADLPVDTIKSVEVSQIDALVNKGAKLLDVRRPGEFEISHVKGSQFFPLANIHDNLGDIVENQQYLIYCAGGYRSMIASSILKSKGYNPINIYGGFDELAAWGIPTVT